MSNKSTPWVDNHLAANGRSIAQNFGAWFAGSKAVGDNGEPLVTYHSTFESFDTFAKTTDVGYHFGSAAIADKRADEASASRGRGWDRYNGFNIIPVFLSIQNPFRLPTDPRAWSPDYLVKLVGDAIPDAEKARILELEEAGVQAARDESKVMIKNKAKGVRRISRPSWDDGPDRFELVNRVWSGLLSKHYVAAYTAIREALQTAGYDGITYINEIEGVGRGRKKRAAAAENLTWVAFDAGQIKSAVSNSGLYLRDSKSLTDRDDALALDRGLAAIQSVRRIEAAKDKAQLVLPGFA